MLILKNTSTNTLVFKDGLSNEDIYIYPNKQEKVNIAYNADLRRIERNGIICVTECDQNQSLINSEIDNQTSLNEPQISEDVVSDTSDGIDANSISDEIHSTEEASTKRSRKSNKEND